MTNAAIFIDWMLYALLAITVALIAYKTIDLLKPEWLGKQSAFQRIPDPQQATTEAENWMTLLAVIAGIAPFLGLVGTVLHIMQALKSIGQSGVDVSVISGPIATALNATLVGLASAIPAAVAYALLSRVIQKQYNQTIANKGD